MLYGTCNLRRHLTRTHCCLALIAGTRDDSGRDKRSKHDPRKFPRLGQVRLHLYFDINHNHCLTTYSRRPCRSGPCRFGSFVQYLKRTVHFEAIPRYSTCEAMRPLSLTRLQRPVVSATVSSRRTRAFHSTRPSPFVAEIVTAATDVLNGIHVTTGLPWVASIPLTAVAVRTAIAFPLQIYSRIHARRRAEIAPLLFVHRKFWEVEIKKQNMKDKIYMRPQQAEQKLRKYLESKSKALHKFWKINKAAPFVPMIQIPIWLSLMEGIRNMCGVNLGLLRYLLPLPDKDGHVIDLPGVEETLANEGALWFPDLLAADATGILPLVLGLSIITNVRLGWKTKTLAEVSDYSTRVMAQFLFAKTLKEVLSATGIYVALTAYVTGMPVGMMLYWIASTNTATLQGRFLDKFLFASKPLKAATPMYMRNLKPGEKPPPIKSLLS
jgi:mitochondrial inner membrane protein COX18